jgi:nicotinate-nucleotide adenylyltransferase
MGMSTDPALEPRIGVLGGTFDPIHLGHLVAAQAVLESLSLEKVLWIPSGHPPHKAGVRVTPAALRWRMVEAALKGDDRFEPVDLEIRRPGPSYTVDTLETLTRIRPKARYFLLLGADQWQDFGRWRAPADIARLARLVVMAREGVVGDPDHLGPPFPWADPAGPMPEIHSVHVPRIDLASSWIRDRVRAGGSARYLVPDPARRILEAERLYL